MIPKNTILINALLLIVYEHGGIFWISLVKELVWWGMLYTFYKNQIQRLTIQSSIQWV